MNDQELWDLIRIGDASAFKQMYDLYADLMYRYGMKCTSNSTDVEDAIQNVFINVFKLRETITITGSLKVYLFAALRNELYLTHRRESKRPESSRLDEDVSDMCYKLDFNLELDPETKIVDEENDSHFEHLIQYAVSQLSERQREVVYLKYSNSLSGVEIAEIMGINHQTVRSTLSNAIAKLREMLLSAKNVAS